MEDASGELYVFSSKGRPFGRPKHDDISDLELNKVYIFVLNNTDDEEIEEHISSYEVLESEQGSVDEIIQEEEPGFVLCVDLGEIPQLVRDVPSLNSIDATIVNAATAETCPSKGRKTLVKKRRLESLGLRDSVSSQGQKSAQGMSTSTTEHNVSTSVSPFHLRDENDEETPLAGDSDIPLTPMSACSVKSSTFVKRGPTRNLSGRKNDDDAPHKVKLDDCYKRVVGPDSQSFINESSAVARKFGKHNVPKWSQLKKEDREAMCQRVMAKFPDDVVDAKMKKAVEQQVNKSYRNRQHKHSRLFKTFKSKEEALSQVPDELPKEEWIYLCNYFTSEKFKGQMRDLESAGYEPKEICIATVGKLPGSAGRALTKSYYVEDVRHEKERADVAEKEKKETDAKLEKMAVEQETLKKKHW
ncbi:OLC1v1023927C1 [Oldenlandia corymbosa var. corymbosa]|uniref:OLC1v1023927C1 n=1 Tax=Oldenlandia corymbosa var. corymbosa TaxID=529605 RepID=A0AAV1C2R4_OLDCO|nr:OLC1v1023927C1 [Oldenlandia corymbosa var. corymbosa]